MTPTRNNEAEAASAVQKAVQRHGSRRDALVQILGDVQAACGWLSRPSIAQVAAAVDLTPAIVEGVASFYRFFNLRPVGQYHLLWSDNIIDQMAGSRSLAKALCRQLRVEPGQIGADGAASVGFTSCIGLGDQGPALLVNHQTALTRMNDQWVVELADLILARVPVADWPAQWRRVDEQVRRKDALLGAAPLRGEALRATVDRGSMQTLDDINTANLRGRGGAGFKTGTKWRVCLGAPIPSGGTRVVVCNADEGEPGTFKDRVLLTSQADTVFEGMTVAARLLGARRGFLYLRGEYRYLCESLEATLAQRRAAGLLGTRILDEADFAFDIDIHVGAGAYVCGEESALIESLEGKRGTPRIRPPFPVEKGYLGQPTVVNNVETFCAAAHIAERGAAWWTDMGTKDSTGTKIHSVSGDCERAGVYEFAFGTSIAHILEECGARRTQAVQVGGPSGICLAAHEFDRCIGFEDVPSAGAFMVFDETRDMFEVARNFSHFFAHESCGFCTPCRVGTQLVARRMDKLGTGYGSLFDETELRDLEGLLRGTSHCGLGATATNPLRDTLQRFRPAYERRLLLPKFAPAFDLDAELEPARRATDRDDAGAHLERLG